ncbi:hypothetical protein ABIA33_003040 [Streptacidiphilus sp. MAP12-16]|uniref:VOC family protein n=1 Tax=Streptacidiphilus sp. MAP12-16 TaxID=3156300 RepID=UPI00351696B8
MFRSDDVDAAFEKVRASGAAVLQEPIGQSWGPCDCAFRDHPSGNTVRISQAAKGKRPGEIGSRALHRLNSSERTARRELTLCLSRVHALSLLILEGAG